jgi:hypothetical protein
MIGAAYSHRPILEQKKLPAGEGAHCRQAGSKNELPQSTGADQVFVPEPARDIKPANAKERFLTDRLPVHACSPETTNRGPLPARRATRPPSI